MVVIDMYRGNILDKFDISKKGLLNNMHEAGSNYFRKDKEPKTPEIIVSENYTNQ